MIQTDLDALDKRVWWEDSETVEYYGTFRDEDYFPSDVSRSGYDHKNIHVFCRACLPATYVEMVWIQCERFTSYFLDHPYMSGRVDSLKRVEILDGDGSTRCAVPGLSIDLLRRLMSMRVRTMFAAELRTLSKCGSNKMKIDAFSGDSTVENVRMINGQVQFCFWDSATERAYDVSLTTDRLYSEGCSEQGSVHIRVVELTEWLSIESSSGRYIAPEKFERQMQMQREGAQLAIGLKAVEYPFLLQVRGYKILVACPIRAIDRVDVVSR